MSDPILPVSVPDSNPKKTKQRNYDLQRDFGITPEFYNQILLEQHGVCVICKRADWRSSGTQGTIRKLAIDHDKQTHLFRGLLCGDCNIALGFFQDDILKLQSAITYLQDNQSGRNPIKLTGRKI